MIFDFEFCNPTKIYFGKNSLDNLEKELVNYGNNILLVYGGGSIKKYGLYDQIISILNKCNKNVFECSGVMPNPTLDKMLEGAKIAKDNNVDLILAVGGGSVIDCAKGISVSAYAEDPFVRYWLNQEPVTNKIIPVASILTMVGTASEMNAGSVITDVERKRKKGRVFDYNVNPKFSILNPELTYTVPKYQMVSGIFDIMSHLMEQYFSGEDDNTSDYLIEALMKSLINSTRIALKDPYNYEARSNIMWCSTMALNKIVGVSKEQDWTVHSIEHQLGAYTDCAHGIGLAVVSIPYYKHIYKNGLSKFVRFAKEVWSINAEGKTDEEVALLGINALENFIKECDIPLTLKELGTTRDMLPLIASSSDTGGYYKFIDHDEILAILNECYE